jgi:hypothetical protein
VATRKKLILQIVLSIFVLLNVGMMGFSRQFYTEALDDAFFGLALASVVILHQRIRPSWLDAAWIAAGTVAFGTVDFHFLHYVPKVMAWFSFLGLSSFAIMALRSIWNRDRRMLLYAWVPAALFVISDYFASDMLEWTAKAHPKTLDLYLLSFDGSLRAQVAFGAGQLYARFPTLHISALIIYIGLAIPITTIYAGRLLRFKEAAFPAMLAFLITGPMGILFYNLFPAAGPHNVFGSNFPFHPFPIADFPRLFLEPVAAPGVRDAMPSLHLAWTLLVWWSSRGLGWTDRFVAFVFLAFTAFATLGTGEHWFIDLVVAFPFALLIQSLCAYQLSWRDSHRMSAILAGLATTLAWLAMLRYAAKVFWLSPIVPWALSAATIALVCVLQARLEHVAAAPEVASAIRARPSWSRLDSVAVRPD